MLLHAVVAGIVPLLVLRSTCKRSSAFLMCWKAPVVAVINCRCAAMIYALFSSAAIALLLIDCTCLLFMLLVQLLLKKMVEHQPLESPGVYLKNKVLSG